MLFLLPAECDEVLNLQQRVAQEQAHEAPALRYVRQEGVGPKLLRHLHYHCQVIIINIVKLSSLSSLSRYLHLGDEVHDHLLGVGPVFLLVQDVLF